MNRVFDVATAIVIVAAITVLVRPNSKGPDLVNALGGSFTGALQAATAF